MEKQADKMLSVVVCTYNRADLLTFCLQSLVDQTIGSERYEVIIVDNNSTDQTQQIVAGFVTEHSNFRAVIEKRQGHSQARNCGWREATGEFVAYIDDDERATSDWCERILQAFETVKPQPAAIGGPYYPIYDCCPPWWFDNSLEIRSWGEKAIFLEKSVAKYGFSGGNMAFKKELLRKYGGFSLDFGLVKGKLRMGEDTEFFFRIYDQNPWFWYDPNIKVFHYTPPNVMRLKYRFRRSFASGASMAYLHKRCFFSKDHLNSIIGFVLFFLKLPFSFIGREKKRVTLMVESFEKLAYQLGYLFGKQ